MLSGCQSKNTDSYIQSMSAYIEEINEIGTSIDCINISSNTAPGEFINKIDSMNQVLGKMAELEDPKDYETIGQLADSALSAMTAASGFYIQAYSGEDGYDVLLGQQARIKYETALTYVQLIGEVLTGQIPAGDDIQVITD